MVPQKDVLPYTVKDTKGSTEVTSKHKERQTISSSSSCYWPSCCRASSSASTMNNECNLISSFVAVKTVDVSCLDFCVGCIISVRNHPDADTLYVEESKYR